MDKRKVGSYLATQIWLLNTAKIISRNVSISYVNLLGRY